MRDVLSLMSEDQFNTIKKYARKYEINFYHMLYYCIYRPRYYCITTAEKKYEAIRTMRYIFKYFFDFVCHFMDNNPELDWSCINYADSFFYFLEDYDNNSRAYVQKAQKEIEQELAEHKGEEPEPLKLKTGTFKKPFYFTHQYCEYSQYYENSLSFDEYGLQKILTPAIEKPDAADIVLGSVNEFQSLMKECMKLRPRGLDNQKLSKEEIDFLNNTIFPKHFYYAELMASLINKNVIEE